MEVITLSRKEISRYQVIKDSLDRKLSNNKAATLLGLSKRQIIRLKNKLRR
ncbi:MAG: integrase, partial [Candidatus Dadabacteria bacterium]